MQCGAMSGLVFCVAKLLSSQDIFHFTLTYNDITHHQSHTLCLSMLWVTFRNDTIFFSLRCRSIPFAHHSSIAV